MVAKSATCAANSVPEECVRPQRTSVGLVDFEIADRAMRIADRTSGNADRAMRIADKTSVIADRALEIADKFPRIAD